jgi:hypothetical protein
MLQRNGNVLQIDARDRCAGTAVFSNPKGATMFKISLIVWIMLGTALAGSAVIAVLAVPSLAAEAMKNIPFAVLIGFAAAVPLSYLVARRIGASAAR